MTLSDNITLTRQQMAEIKSDIRLFLSKFLLVDQLFAKLGLNVTVDPELPWIGVCEEDGVGRLDWCYDPEISVTPGGKYHRECPALDIGFWPHGSAGLGLSFNVEKGWRAWIDQGRLIRQVSPLILEITEHFKIPGLDQSDDPFKVLGGFAEDVRGAERLGIAPTKPEIFAWLEEKDVLVILKAIAKPFISSPSP